MLRIKDPYLQSIVVGTVCLFIAALLLVSVYLAFFLKFYPEFGSYADRQAVKPVDAVVMKGRSFVPIGLVPTEFVGDGHRVNLYVDNQAMLVSPQYVDVADFPFVRFDIEGVHRDMAVKLIWRRLDMPTGEYHEAFLHTSGDGMHWHNMAKYPEWSGTLVEIGIGGVGRSQDERFVLMRDEPFLLRTVELMPFSRTGVVKTIWDEWTYFEGWDHSSVNHYRGFPSGALLPPNPVAMVWLLVGALVFGAGLGVLRVMEVKKVRISRGLGGEVSRGEDVGSFGDGVGLNVGGVMLAMFMMCWLSQDALRMQFRFKQAVDTHYLFAGYTLEEKAARSRLRCDGMLAQRSRDCRMAHPLPYL